MKRKKKYVLFTYISGLLLMAICAATAQADIFLTHSGGITKLTNSGVSSDFVVYDPNEIERDEFGNPVLEFNCQYDSDTDEDICGEFPIKVRRDPYDIVVDAAGNFFVADARTRSIYKYTPEGVYSVFFEAGRQYPKALAFDSQGNLYASLDNTVRKFSPTGDDLGVFATTSTGNIGAMKFDTEGDLYVLSSSRSTNFAGHVTRISPDGGSTIYGITPELGSGWSGLAFDSVGNLYASNFMTDRIVVFPPGGGGSIDFATMPRPTDLHFDRYGNLFAPSYRGGNLHKFNITDGLLSNDYTVIATGVQGLIGIDIVKTSPLIDLGNVTQDSDSGLFWLDATETAGMSYNEVLAELGPGGTFQGYRYATLAELEGFLIAAGGTAPFLGFGVEIRLPLDSWVTGLRALWGSTAVQSDFNEYTAVLWGESDTDTYEEYICDGEDCDFQQVTADRVETGILQDFYGGGYATARFGVGQYYRQTVDYSSSVLGSALVREDTNGDGFFEQGGFSYAVAGLTTVKLTGRTLSSSDTEIVIPDTVTYNGTTYSVTTIEGLAFNDNGLTSVTIPGSVTTIGNSAFSDNSLTSVTFLGDFGAFNVDMFEGNNNLTTIIYAQGATGWPQTFTPNTGPTGSVAATTTTEPQITTSDFNGDNRSDILWRKPVNGEVKLIVNDGLGAQANAISMQPKSSAWTAQKGDFNGDNRTDLLWRNSVTGAANIDFSNVDGGLLLSINVELHDSDWLSAVGDFNGDGIDDILWRQPLLGKVKVAILATDGSTLRTEILSNRYSAWGHQLGDFNGDGRTDIFWRKRSTGDVKIALSDAMGKQGLVSVHFNKWNAWGGTVGDFNGDGRSDILWRKPNTGETKVAISGENGEQLNVIGHFTRFNAWTDTVGDFNGDGRDDILWRRPASGEVKIAVSDDQGGQSRGVNHNAKFSAWDQAVGDYNGDGIDDVLWRKPVVGTVKIILNNTNAEQSSVVGHFDKGANWKLVH